MHSYSSRMTGVLVPLTLSRKSCVACLLFKMSAVISIWGLRASRTAQDLPMPERPRTHTAGPRLVNSYSVFCLGLTRKRSMDEEDESLSKQVMNLVLENTGLLSVLTGYIVFNVAILILLVYISVRISLK